jgi:hypothetical protein
MKEINNNFISFVKHEWQDFIEGSHHKKISEKFNLLSKNKIHRLIINIPPRHTKSSFASFLFPAWILGCKPNLKIIQIAYDNENSIRFLSKIKKLINKPSYKKIFKTRLKKSSEIHNKLETEQGGEYCVTTFGSDISSCGVDLLIIDDPHSKQESLDESKLKKTYDWFSKKPLQLLQPTGAIVIVMTRSSSEDLTGFLLDTNTKLKVNKWEVLKLPVITQNGAPLWPQFWKLDELKQIKDSVSKEEWNFKWMQNSKSD